MLLIYYIALLTYFKTAICIIFNSNLFRDKFVKFKKTEDPKLSGEYF